VNWNPQKKRNPRKMSKSTLLANLQQIKRMMNRRKTVRKKKMTRRTKLMKLPLVLRRNNILKMKPTIDLRKNSSWSSQKSRTKLSTWSS
jgi:hypothetical protein